MILLAILSLVVETSDLLGSPNIPQPPVRFQGDNTVIVTFAKPSLLQELCRQRADPRNPELIACADILPPSAHLPNPCGINEHYAKVACHELGHANGWTREHEQ